MLMRRRLWGLRLARIQPYVMAAGLLWMAVFGGAAGLAGVPRRYALLGADAPASWTTLMNLALGIGATTAIAAGIVFVLIMVMTAVAGERTETSAEAVTDLMQAPPDVVAGIGRTPIALVPAIAFVVCMLVITIVALQRLWALPIRLQ
jgi:heme/copper-type cytochrome/quinol oxidase subunit 1